MSDIPSNVLNPNLYRKAKKKIKSQVKVWPSAYASGMLVQEYKRLGGKYSGRKNTNTGVGRWYKEKWVNVCEKKGNGKYPPCGRENSKIKDYPYCRPSIRITKGTPRTVKELGKKKIDEMCKKKRKKGLPKDGKPQYVSQ